MEKSVGFSDFAQAWDEAIAGVCRALKIEDGDAYNLELATATKVAVDARTPFLIVLNGPAGAGKSTAGKMLESLGYSRIPHITSRQMREGEVHGRDYHFVAAETFLKHLSRGEVLSAKTTYGHHRGFLKQDFDRIVRGGLFYTEGESSLKAILEYSQANPVDLELVLNIFLIPPSGKEWVRRIDSQASAGHFTAEERAHRLTEGVEYLRKSTGHLDRFPRSLYLVNDDFYRLECILKAFAKGGGLTPIESSAKVGTKEYAHEKGIMHPIVIVYVFNSKGELLLQQRQDTGTWDHSAAGHLELGESPELAAARELKEELGFTAPLVEIYSGPLIHSRIPESRRHRGHIYRTVHDGDFRLQDSEVRSVRFVALSALKKEIETHPERFNGGFLATFESFLDKMA